MQHGAIADSVASRRIWGVKQSLELLSQEKRNQASIGFLERNCQYTADLLQGRRLPIFQEVEKGLDCRQTDIAGFRRIFAFVFQILQESADQSRVQLLQCQRRWGDFEFFRREQEEELETVSIRVACVLADASVTGERLKEESFDEGRDQRHDCAPSDKNISPTAATSRMRSAVASRYQYVA